MVPVNLIDLCSKGFKQFLSSFDHVFSDCDGVIWTASRSLHGVGDFFRLMKENGKSVHYVSNNSMRSIENYAKMFERSGVPDGIENLTVPSVAMAEYLKSINFNKHIYCVTCSEARKMFESYGFKTKTGPDIGCDSYVDYAEYLVDDADIGAVAFDSDFKVSMPKLYQASTYLKRPEVLFLNGPTDKYVLFCGQLVLATAFTADVVADLVKRQPLCLGKPSKDFGEFAMQRAGVKDPSRVLFIGDMIEQDIRLGKNTGFKTLLVLTHCTEEEMRAHEIQPDFFVSSLGSVVYKFNTSAVANGFIRPSCVNFTS